nr:MAG TPA: hypothetical protein [Caudoviricetes sp.]
MLLVYYIVLFIIISIPARPPLLYTQNTNLSSSFVKFNCKQFMNKYY